MRKKLTCIDISKLLELKKKMCIRDSTVYGILLDSNNGIWMSTNGGISKLSLEDGTFMNFTISDGLQSNEFNGRSSFKSKDGKLFFGGINGFNVFDPDSVELSLFKPEKMCIRDRIYVLLLYNFYHLQLQI